MYGGFLLNDIFRHVYMSYDFAILSINFDKRGGGGNKTLSRGKI